MGCTKRGSPSYSGDGLHRGPNGLCNFQSPYSPTKERTSGFTVGREPISAVCWLFSCPAFSQPQWFTLTTGRMSHCLAYPEGVVGRIKWDNIWDVIRIHWCTNRLLEPLDTNDMPILFSIFGWRLIKLENALHARSHTNHWLTVALVCLLITQNTSPQT